LSERTVRTLDACAARLIGGGRANMGSGDTEGTGDGDTKARSS
jgi:hypothetical protein